MALRIGTLGAARITPAALVKPARRTGAAEVVAVAARDPERARAFAGTHGIPTVHRTYDELIADPTVDAVYNPLPNGLHGRYTLAALAAGKPVLCEKPFTANAEEARVVAGAAAASGLVVMEAFHYRYHPMAARLLEILASGELGDIVRIEAGLSFPLPRTSDIRFQADLAGGALMDAGCYPVHLLRTLAGGEPEVTSAQAKLASPGVDRAMRATFSLPGGGDGAIRCSMLSSDVLRVTASVQGDRGSLKVLNPFSPQAFNRVSVRTPVERRVEHLTREPTYDFQLRAFVAAVTSGTPVLTPPEDSVRTMTVIDAIYRAAGLEPRQPTGAELAGGGR
ncbi:MAG TPA: Gfo/Idh/MocA family oxidoreductase [Acidimicrobiales bacterium]|nr:Gfo/Idh/MocA family oxidoreductase [Acidimicrobiales bacterium]